jgi:hypothetical protein
LAVKVVLGKRSDSRRFQKALEEKWRGDGSCGEGELK